MVQSIKSRFLGFHKRHVWLHTHRSENTTLEKIQVIQKFRKVGSRRTRREKTANARTTGRPIWPPVIWRARNATWLRLKSWWKKVISSHMSIKVIVWSFTWTFTVIFLHQNFCGMWKVEREIDWMAFSLTLVNFRCDGDSSAMGELSMDNSYHPIEIARAPGPPQWESSIRDSYLEPPRIWYCNRSVVDCTRYQYSRSLCTWYYTLW